LIASKFSQRGLEKSRSRFFIFVKVLALADVNAFGKINSFLSLTITNAITRIDTNIKSIGSINRFRIVQVDTNALVLEKSGSTNYFER